MPACRAVLVAGRLGQTLEGGTGRGAGVRRSECGFPVWRPLAAGAAFVRELKCFLFPLKVYILSNSLLVLRLGLGASTLKGPGSIVGWGAKIP